jgi:hypothetical protein
MNEIILAPCDAGYVQSCTGLKRTWIFKKEIGFLKKFFFKKEIGFKKKEFAFSQSVICDLEDNIVQHVFF